VALRIFRTGSFRRLLALQPVREHREDLGKLITPDENEINDLEKRGKGGGRTRARLEGRNLSDQSGGVSRVFIFSLTLDVALFRETRETGRSLEVSRCSRAERASTSETERSVRALSSAIRSTRLEAQGRLINCFRSIIGCDKSCRLQVVAWLVSEEIERRHPSLSLSLSLPPPSCSRTIGHVQSHIAVQRVLCTLAKLEGKIEKLVPPRLTSPDPGANRWRMFPRKLGPKLRSAPLRSAFFRH